MQAGSCCFTVLVAHWLLGQLPGLTRRLMAVGRCGELCPWLRQPSQPAYYLELNRNCFYPMMVFLAMLTLVMCLSGSVTDKAIGPGYYFCCIQNLT